MAAVLQESDGPRADVFRPLKRGEEGRPVEALGHVQGPERAQAVDFVRARGDEAREFTDGGIRHPDACLPAIDAIGAIGENASGLAGEPVVGAELKRRQGVVAEFREVDGIARPDGAVGDFEDTTAVAVDAVVVVALAGVAPIADEDAAVRRGDQVHAAEPGIGEGKCVGFAAGDEAAAGAFEAFDVQAAAVEIDREELPVPGLGPLAALVDEESDVGVAAAGGQGRAGDAFADVGPDLAGCPVDLVGGLLEEFVDVGIGVLAEHAAVMGAWDDVPEVADDGVDEEGFAVRVPIHAPGVGGALGNDFEDDDPVAELGMITDGRLRVGVVFGDPETAAGIGRRGDGLADVGFRGEDGECKPGGSSTRPAASSAASGRARDHWVLNGAGNGAFRRDHAS